MNHREGFRRVGLVLGVIGAIIGLIVALSLEKELYHTRENAKKQATEDWANARIGKRVKAKYPGDYDDMTDKEVGRRAKGKKPWEWFQENAPVGKYSLEDMGYDGPPLWAYLMPTPLPFIGFLFPWGTVRVFYWVIAGFLKAFKKASVVSALASQRLRSTRVLTSILPFRCLF